MGNRLRSEDTTVQVMVDGERIVGTKIKITQWDLSLGIMVDAEEYAGQHGESYREVYKGGEFNFSGRPLRPVWPTLVELVRKRAIGEASGRIDLFVTGRFRNGERVRYQFIDCFFENPNTSGQGQELVEEKYSGKCHITRVKAA